jgi:hypothetical protein
MLDREERWLYFFISTYAGELARQGVAVARMPWSDRDAPVGKVRKWHNQDWTAAGLGGPVSPIFPARIDWHQPNADALWGPSIHWNSHLNRYVILLNRANDAHWAQEGVYVTFNADLSKPSAWSEPVKILGDLGPDRWYPQIVGVDKSRQDTDKLAGRVARLFVRGRSAWEIVFLRPGEEP